MKEKNVHVVGQSNFVVMVMTRTLIILTLSLPESIIMETCSALVLTFESVDKILWCDHSNETSSAVHFLRKH